MNFNKKTTKIFFFSICLSAKIMAQIGINATGAVPDAKAILDVSSTNKGFLFPRMTTAQRNAISTAPGVTPEGLTVFDTDTKNLWVWSNAAWKPYMQSAWEFYGNDIVNINPGNIGVGGPPSPTAKLKVHGILGVSNVADTKSMTYDPTVSNDLYFSGGNANITTGAANSNLILQQWADTKVAIGSITPTQKLDISGQIRIRGGSPGLGKVLTSAADGTGSWENATLPTHNHFGELWTNSLAGNGLEIRNGDNANSSTALRGSMTASGTAQNTGVLGTTESSLGRGVMGVNFSSGSTGLPGLGAGVSGTSGTGAGVHGNSVSGASIHGVKTSGSGFGNAGLFERTNGASPDATVLISNNNESQTALELRNGYLKVSGASNKTAFIITAGAVGTTIFGNLVRFSYPGMSSSDILIVNHQYVGNYIGAVGNWYDTVNSRWTIFREDQLAMPANERFTVLVIKQ